MALSSFTDWLKRNSSPVKTIQNQLNKPQTKTPSTVGGGGGGGGGGSWDAPNPLTYQQPTYQTNLQPISQYGEESATSTGGSTGGSTVDQDTLQKNSILEAIRSKYSGIKSVFDGLFKSLDDVVNEKSSKLDKDYQQQQNDLVNQYTKTAEQQQNMFGARGLQNSSYFTNAQSEAADIYGRNFDAINTANQEGRANLGKFVATTKANLNNSLAGAGEYLGNIENNIGGLSLADLQAAQGDFNNLAGNLESQAVGLQTNPQYIQQLSQLSTPAQNAGTAQLAQRLQTLVTSSAPIFAKRQIAQGLIRAANLTDENAKGYWQNQFEELLKQNGQA